MSDELAAEDLFRLNVLLTQDLKAIRLDEATPAVQALTGQGEATIPLNPSCRADRYMRLVREFLSGHALGSPGGYPVHLTRWTRHGQMESENLGKLLLTGEPEAVVAVVHSPSLSDEIAEYAWWAMPTIENARLMLRRENVAHGRMGTVLATFLVEHLPFLQEDNLAIMDTVAVLLYSGVLSEAQREAVWKRGKRENSHYVAFLEMCPEQLPLPAPARSDHAATLASLGDEAARNPLLGRLLLALSGQGQTFLAACQEILERPETQEVVSRTLSALGRHFSVPDADQSLSAAQEALQGCCPDRLTDLDSMIALGQVSEAATAAIFARSTAIGSLMRRKIDPITAPILGHLRRLRGITK